MIEELKKIFPQKVLLDEKDLSFYTGDLWPRKLIQKRLNQKLNIPRAIVKPQTIQDVQKLLQWANQEKIAIVPLGGGSGVCGGATPVGDCVLLDFRELNRIEEINSKAQYVRAQAGILGPDLEEALNKKGLTLNHAPTSFAISTLGGWISTRAAGQLSTAYGSIEDMVLAMKVVLANGKLLETKLTPRSAAGPSLKELFLGAEGTLGIVVEATCQVHELPKTREFLSFSFDDVSKGLLAVRLFIQKGIFPAVVRLYDETDTQLALAEVKIEASGNLLVVIFQGDQDFVQFQKNKVKDFFSKEGKDLGEKPAKHWWENRFTLNEKKLVQMLSQEGVILDTIEVATTWNYLEDLYQNMKKAMQETGVLVLAHFSHFYLTGASIYFTFVGNVEEKESLIQYDLVWEKAMDACLKSHGTISHHHGIGLLRKKWLKQELGEGWNVLSVIKKTMDPLHILNPGKLL